MRSLRTTLTILAVGLSLAVWSQTSREELLAHIELASSNYCNYPQPTGRLTPPPPGYEPFFINHYGRHGARYITSDKQYKYLVGKLDTAQTMRLLTPLGEDALRRLKVAYADAYQRDGDLTRLGARQHRAIAHRMGVNYPSLFSQRITVNANSSTVRRCILSMANCCLELTSMYPQLNIQMDASEHDMYYLIPNTASRYRSRSGTANSTISSPTSRRECSTAGTRWLFSSTIPSRPDNRSTPTSWPTTCGT